MNLNVYSKGTTQTKLVKLNTHVIGPVIVIYLFSMLIAIRYIHRLNIELKRLFLVVLNDTHSSEVLVYGWLQNAIVTKSLISTSSL